MRLLLCAAAGALALPLAARADEAVEETEEVGESDDERAQMHFRVAQEYFEEERFEDALDEFEEAYELSGRPQLLYNIGLCHDRLGQWEEAKQRYQRFLELAPDDSYADAARERLERAEERAAVEDESDGGGIAWLPWTLIGVGAAAAVTAVATGVVAGGIHNDLEESCPGRVCASSEEGDIDKGRRLARTSTAMTFIAGAAAVTGVILLVVGGSSDDDEDGVEAHVAPLPGGAYAGARLHF